MNSSEYGLKVESMRKKLFKIAFLNLDNKDDALEAVDEAVYRGLKNLKKLKQEEYFETWLIRILINICHDERKRRGKFLNIEDVPEQSAEMYDSLSVKDGVKRLPEDLRNVIVLRFFAGYSVSETGKILDIPDGTVGSRQKRAMELLRISLGEEEL